jgi:hypothetical protein
MRNVRFFRALSACIAIAFGVSAAHAQFRGASAANRSWSFAVSGDSRNCGNIVMPAIAAAARADGASFYWHLGDLRAIYKIDEDFAAERRFENFSYPPSISDYLHTAWDDFEQHQVKPFGDMPFFIGIGNHEVIPPKSRAQFRIAFAALLDRPELHAQRSLDAHAHPAIPATPADATYYHWTMGGVDFINLDNTENDSLDAAQLTWLDAVLDTDLTEPAIRNIVVGMHEPLPHSLSDDHSMCASTEGIRSGEQVHRRLAAVQKRKPVYVIASHEHYYLANVYDTPYWRDPAHGAAVLPGWVIGTAGAVRYPLPEGVHSSPNAREHVYGYLLGHVAKDGRILFTFREIDEAAAQSARGPDYSQDTVHFCMAKNPETLPPPPKEVSCELPH